jgi:hypothetical protein
MIAIETPDARDCEYRTTLAESDGTGAIPGLSVQRLMKLALFGPQFSAVHFSI